MLVMGSRAWLPSVCAAWVGVVISGQAPTKCCKELFLVPTIPRALEFPDFFPCRYRARSSAKQTCGSASWRRNWTARPRMRMTVWKRYRQSWMRPRRCSKRKRSKCEMGLLLEGL